jgi:hypothetical protein
LSRKLRNALHNLYFSLYIVEIIKSKRIGWAEHVAFMEEISSCKVLVEKPEGERE